MCNCVCDSLISRDYSNYSFNDAQTFVNLCLFDNILCLELRKTIQDVPKLHNYYYDIKEVMHI